MDNVIRGGGGANSGLPPSILHEQPIKRTPLSVLSHYGCPASPLLAISLSLCFNHILSLPARPSIPASRDTADNS